MSAGQGVWHGGRTGASVGAYAGPWGAVAGGVAGAIIGGLAGWWLGNAIADQVSEANKTAEEELSDQVATDACSNCPPPECGPLNKQIKQARDKVVQRHQELREDRYNLFRDYYSSPHPQYGSWLGHVAQYDGWRRRLHSLLDKARTLGCPIETDDAGKVGDEPAPTQPAPK